ncbi:hypothetical protein ASE04_26995 [Rhizobium sp. Root708]|nr:hypothetical protein ASE04_26995 [Rhizobium sp. Root708]
MQRRAIQEWASIALNTSKPGEDVPFKIIRLQEERSRTPERLAIRVELEGRKPPLDQISGRASIASS